MSLQSYFSHSLLFKENAEGFNHSTDLHSSTMLLVTEYCDSSFTLVQAVCSSFESGSFRPLSRSPLSRFAHFPFRPESFRPGLFRPLSRSPLSRFAHFPVRSLVVSPPYKILFLLLIFWPQKWYKALIFLLIGDVSL